MFPPLTVIINHHFHVVHDFRVAAVGFLGHFGDASAVADDARRLRVEHKRHREETLDPFDELVSSVRLERILSSGQRREQNSISVGGKGQIAAQ